MDSSYDLQDLWSWPTWIKDFQTHASGGKGKRDLKKEKLKKKGKKKVDDERTNYREPVVADKETPAVAGGMAVSLRATSHEFR